MIPYAPKKICNPDRERESTWGNIPTIILDIIERTGIGRKKALDFGTFLGCSTSTFANYFEQVIGIDRFEAQNGDLSEEGTKAQYLEIVKRLSRFNNIVLLRIDALDYISFTEMRFDLIHVDLYHSYRETFDVGVWAIKHADVVLFHDTMSFPSVAEACRDLSEIYKLNFYNYPFDDGLGILTKKEL